MAIDYCIAFECEAKRHFGQGDAARGSLDILDRLKARNRAKASRELASQYGEPGEDPIVGCVTINVGEEPVEKELHLSDLEAAALALVEHEHACASCTANALSEPYGCFGAINYPISREGESWLMSRVQPPNTMGAQMCAEFMAEFDVTGDKVKEMRDDGDMYFEASRAATVALTKGLLKRTSLSANQLLEAILMGSDLLEPDNSIGILLWLGAIRIEGAIPSSFEDQALLKKLIELRTQEQKKKHTQLELGPKACSESVIPFQVLIRSMYVSWIHDVPLYISF